MSSNSHYDQCLTKARLHHIHLARTVKNQWTIEGLMKTYLDQPAFDGYRDQLLRAVMGS